jgi:hypothetical protein
MRTETERPVAPPAPDDAGPLRSAGSRAHRRQRQPGIGLDCGAGTGVRHVGIVFVHGIGTQRAGETLLDWGGAVIRALLDVRVGHEASADPVIDCQLDPGPGESRYIELQLPETTIDGTTVPEQHWVMTEAWGGARGRPPPGGPNEEWGRPPAFGQMAEWLGPRGAIRRILLALLPRGRGIHDPRLRPSVEHHPLRRAVGGLVEEVAEHGPPEGMTSEPKGRLRGATRVTAQLYLQAIAALILVVYGALRSIEKLVPIGPLKDGVLTRPIDEFVLEWFGDVYVLLGDPAQAASVRGRLIDALSDLQAVRCDEINVVAHSGGAIVSYMTLADQASTHLQVDRLITLGEGLNLAWLLTAGQDRDALDDARIRYERLYKPVLETRPDLSWHDFWASQDPAPVGVLQFPSVGSEGMDERLLGRVESHSVWNRLSFGEDHGGYWDNDEEFLLPMLRLLENRPGAKALFGDDADDRARSNHRRRRLSLLSLWRQASMSAPLSAIVVAFALGSGFVNRAGDAVAGAFAALPGAQVVADPLVAARSAGIDGNTIARFVAETCVWIVAVVIALATAYSLIAPAERPIPWARVPRRAWIGTFMRLAPWIAGIPIGAALVVAALRFAGGSTATAVEVGQIVAGAAAAVVIGLVILPAVLAQPAAGPDVEQRSALREGWDLLRTVLVLVVAGIVVLAPFVAIVLFPDVGRMVLGSVAVVVAFQILGRVGGWRWSVWDARERMAARTGAREYPGVRRVALQATLLIATVAALLVAVIADSDAALVLALGGLVAAVLFGVSIDVIDAARQDRRTPADSLIRHARAARAN